MHIRNPREAAPSPEERTKGAAAVEFVLVLPLLLLLVFGLVQYGWTFYQIQEASFAVREGSRSAAVGMRDRAGVAGLVTAKINSTVVAPEGVTTCYADTNGDGELTVGDEIRVHAAFAATEFGFPFVPFPADLQIDQDALTRTENVTASSDYPACP